MKKLLKTFYTRLNIDTNNWNWLQLLFGKNYLGLVIILLSIVYIFVSNQ